MENYIVRIRRRSADGKEVFTGLVERVETGRKVPFKDCAQFMRIIKCTECAGRKTCIKTDLTQTMKAILEDDNDL